MPVPVHGSATPNDYGDPISRTPSPRNELSPRDQRLVDTTRATVRVIANAQNNIRSGPSLEIAVQSLIQIRDDALPALIRNLTHQDCVLTSERHPRSTLPTVNRETLFRDQRLVVEAIEVRTNVDAAIQEVN